MVVSVGMRLQDGPWGGGNQFGSSLAAFLRARGIQVIFDLHHPAIDVILLTEPRVSGVHATVRLDGGQLLVRDENSNNGTHVNGTRLSAGVWTPAPNGSLVRFGPVEFTVRLE